MRALLLTLGDDHYAVDVAEAREVVAAPDITAVPTAPPTVLGVFNLRGEIVPVFDTGRLLGLGPMASVEYAAIVETSLGPAALATTSMGETAELGDAAGTSDAPGTAGAFDAGSRLAVLLDVEALLASAHNTV